MASKVPDNHGHKSSKFISLRLESAPQLAHGRQSSCRNRATLSSITTQAGASDGPVMISDAPHHWHHPADAPSCEARSSRANAKLFHLGSLMGAEMSLAICSQLTPASLFTASVLAGKSNVTGKKHSLGIYFIRAPR